MTDFANSFSVRYPTLGSVWKALAEGETPDNLPVEWKSINYYAHVFSYDDDATVKMSAQAFLREVEVARLDPQTYAGHLMLATQAFAQAICDQARIPWQEDRRKAVPTPRERQALKPKSPAKARARKAKRPA
jgi:cytochrome c-type biogenesis protein CcmH/NrfG